MSTYSTVAALTLQLCNWQPTPEVVRDVYAVMFHRPLPGHAHYVARAMCEARERPYPYNSFEPTCPKVNNVCLND